MNFDQYEPEPIPDGMGTLYFNKEYGVLGFINGWGYQIHFLSDQAKEEIKFPIFFDPQNLND